MSRRSVQAARLARSLSTATGTQVDISHERGDLWYVTWADGPTSDQIRDHLAGALREAAYTEMADRQLRYHRSHSPRAWAATAIAATRQSGSLRHEINAGASHRHRIGVARRRPGERTVQEDALLAHIERLINQTPYPDRAATPGDEPLITRLLTAGGRDEYRMARILLDELGYQRSRP